MISIPSPPPSSIQQPRETSECSKQRKFTSRQRKILSSGIINHLNQGLMTSCRNSPTRPWLCLPFRLGSVGPTFRRLPLCRVDVRAGPGRRVHDRTEWLDGVREAVDATDASRCVEISRAFVSSPADNVVNRPGHVAAALPSRFEVVDRAHREVVHRLPHVRWRRGRPWRALRDVRERRRARPGCQRVVLAVRHLHVGLGPRVHAGAGLVRGGVEA